jgi:hypothetical protein
VGGVKAPGIGLLDLGLGFNPRLLQVGLAEVMKVN